MAAGVSGGKGERERETREAPVVTVMVVAAAAAGGWGRHPGSAISLLCLPPLSCLFLK